MFRLGQFTATSGALAALDEAGQIPLEFIARHAKGGWGDQDKETNDQAVLGGGRIFSAYRTKLGTKLWVITGADRRVTIILLPEDS
jgi:hypothetical protein